MNMPGLGLESDQDYKGKPLDEQVLAKLAHAFIQHSILDGEKSSRQVSDHLAVMQEQLLIAQQELTKVSKIGVSAKVNHTIAEALMAALSELSKATVALQFFDRTAQRLNHAGNVLGLFHDKDAMINTQDSAEVRRAMVRAYNGLSMEDERVLFKAIENGENLKKSVKAAQKALASTINNVNNIELF